MIQYNEIGQSPGDNGDSLRRKRPAHPSDDADLIEIAGTSIFIRGDVPEGVSPRKTVSSIGTSGICRQWLTEIRTAIDAGSRVSTRMALFAASHWVSAELARTTPPLPAVVLAEICSLQTHIVAAESGLGEWYAFQLGCEGRLEKKLVGDWRAGRLDISWSELQYAVLPRLHMLPVADLIGDRHHRGRIARQLSALDWRPA